MSQIQEGSGVSIDLSGMTDRELRGLQDSIIQEQALRRRLDASPEKIERAIAEYQEAHGIGRGEEWVPPGSVLRAYRANAEVKHEGKDWASVVNLNVGEPGRGNGWRENPKHQEANDD